LPELRGIGRRMPWTMGAFTVGALSMIGVPPTAGFVSKWYILAGSFEADNLLAIFTIIASTALNAAYFLPIIFMAWFGREEAGSRDHGEAPLLVVLALTTTALLTLGFFFFNGPVIDLETQLVQEFQ
jgi:multicomponent Na+:H+ antiporter subunit D